MNEGSFSRGAMIVATLLVLAPGVALAEPTRNANIWDWKAHEPVPSEIQSKERAAGVAPTAQQQQAADRELESLYRSLIQQPRPEQARSTNRSAG